MAATEDASEIFKKFELQLSLRSTGVLFREIIKLRKHQAGRY